MKGPSLKTEFSITSRPVTGFSRLGFKLFLSAFNLYQILLEHRFVLYLFFYNWLLFYFTVSGIGL